VWAEAALTRATEIGQARQIAAARGFLGVVSLRQGDYSGAATWLDASLATWRDREHRAWRSSWRPLADTIDVNR
jgi:hypothetical protein